MVQTITPVVHGGSRRRWVEALALHVLGSGLAASALGAALGAIGRLLEGPWGRASLLMVAAVAGLYAVRELGRVPVPIPELRRQVPEWWRGFFSPRTTSFLYGLGLGVGFFTHLRHGTLVAVAATAFASSDPLIGAMLLAPFGLARASVVAVAGGARSEDDVRRVTDRLERLALRWPGRTANGLLLLAVGVAAILAAVAGRHGDWDSPAGALLGAAFGWAALSKFLRPQAWRESLRAHRMPPLLERTALLAVPAGEAAVTMLILVGSNVVAAGLGLVLLGVFSVAVLRARRVHGDRLPCGCFGRAGVRHYRILLARNAALALVAGWALLGVAPGAGLRLPGPGEVLPAALAVAGLGLVVWVARLAFASLRAARRPAPGS